MTYCLGQNVREGLVGIADTRITSGTDTSVKVKMLTLQKDKFSIFIMTSGLRSIRDKAIVYFKELIEKEEYSKMFMVVNAFGEQVRKVAKEDKTYLEKSGFKFDLHTIIGGQLKEDEEHKLFLLYPEGNWVELGYGAPFVVIGNSGHGKAILNRILHEETDMRTALKVGFLSFDSTRVSSNNVDYPIDVVLYEKDHFKLAETRYEQDDLGHVSTLWASELKNALTHLPDEWMELTFKKLNQQNNLKNEA